MVISADLIWPGVQVGCSAFTRMAEPAMCGEDIEVPAIAWKYWPGGPPATSSGVGVLPARICTPGAVMSGLMKLPARAARGERRHHVALAGGLHALR